MKKEVNEIIEAVRCFDKQEKLGIINHLLDEQEATLESISKSLRMKKPTVYKYIGQMLNAGIVSYRKLPGKKGKMLFRMEDISLSINEKRIRDAFRIGKHGKFLIIFDVDDTLIRRSDIPEQLSKVTKNAINEAKSLLQRRGIAISMPPEELFTSEWIYSKYGNSIEWYISTYLNVSGVPNGEVKENLVKKHVKEYYRSIEITAPRCNMFKDVKPFLEKMKDNAYFAAMSNSSKKTIIEEFRSNGILRYFMRKGKPLVVGGDEIPKSKATLEAIFRMADVGPKHSFIIGDTGGDIKAAREAGIPPHKTIAISRGITPVETLEAISPKVKITESLSALAI